MSISCFMTYIKKKTRILHQHIVWERNYRDCAAKLQILFDSCMFFMRNLHKRRDRGRGTEGQVSVLLTYCF